MAEMSELRAKHRALIAKMAALVNEFERETGLRVRSATVTRDAHELAVLLGGAEVPEGPAGVCWIVPHAEV